MNGMSCQTDNGVHRGVEVHDMLREWHVPSGCNIGHLCHGYKQQQMPMPRTLGFKQIVRFVFSKGCTADYGSSQGVW